MQTPHLMDGFTSGWIAFMISYPTGKINARTGASPRSAAGPWRAAAKPARRCNRPAIIFVAVHKKQEKFSPEIPKFFLTSEGGTAILAKRLCESRGVLCEEAGDCSGIRGNFRGVCPVSEEYPARNRAAETCFCTRVYRVHGDRPAIWPVLFFGHGLIRTVVCTKIVSSVRIREADPMPPQNVRKEGEITHGKQQEHDPHPPEGL